MGAIGPVVAGSETTICGTVAAKAIAANVEDQATMMMSEKRLVDDSEDVERVRSDDERAGTLGIIRLRRAAVLGRARLGSSSFKPPWTGAGITELERPMLEPICSSRSDDNLHTADQAAHKQQA